MIIKAKINDVVQIDPAIETFGGCFLVVTDEYQWGVQGYVTVPDKGRAYFRVEHDKYAVIGQAEWVLTPGLV